MKRTSLLGSLALVIVSFTGCVIHSAHIDPYTGCRTGCSIEAVPDGPLDCCFYVRILQCPLFPWNWGQFLGNCDICDVPPCGGCGWGGGCGHGCGPAYPPMLTGGCCDTGCDVGCGSTCGGYGGGFVGHDYGGFPAPLTHSAMGGGCCDAPMPSYGPMPPQHGPMTGPHGPHGGAFHAPGFGDPVPQRMPPGGMGRPPQGPMGPMNAPMGQPMGPMGPMNPPMGPMNPAPMPNMPPGMAPAALMSPTTSYMPSTANGPSYFHKVTGPRVASPYATTHQVDYGTITPVSASASLPVVAPH